jgi:hypothetical protein
MPSQKWFSLGTLKWLWAMDFFFFFFFADWELLHGFWRGIDQISACPRPLVGTHNCLQLRLHQCINDGDGNHRW